MPRITVHTNGMQFRRKLTDIGTQQLPFALANTLSRTAEEAVAVNKAALPSRFIVRRNWIAKGYRVDHATKASLRATIRHLDPFMLLQETGGDKTPGPAGVVAIPEGARPTPQSVTPPNLWPGRIPRHFYVGQGANRYEFQRMSKRARLRKGTGNGTPHGAGHEAIRGRDPSVVLMYVLRQSVRIPPRLNLVNDTKATIADRLAINFDGFLRAAIATAK